MKCKITENFFDRFIVKDLETNEHKIAFLSGNVKKKNSVLTGDIVQVEKKYDKNIIVNIDKRKNELIRPPVANIDNLIIVLSLKNPTPDYMLLDKQLVLCYFKNINPIICVNKLDLLDEDSKKEIEYINKVYKNNGYDVFYTSSKTEENIDLLLKKIEGTTSAFSGNSGVGKSSITNIILKNKSNNNDVQTLKLEIGDIARKTKRGKHTTKKVSLFELENNTYILDTPGFSSYELYDIPYKELKHAYVEFSKYNCEFSDCAHVIENEDVCLVKRNVKCSNIDKNRYERYVYLYDKLKKIDDRKYK